MREARNGREKGLIGRHSGSSGQASELVLQFARLGLKSWMVGSLNGSCTETIRTKLNALFDQHKYVEAMAVRNDVRRQVSAAVPDSSACRRLVHGSR
jgi:hypothetical protein